MTADKMGKMWSGWQYAASFMVVISSLLAVLGGCSSVQEILPASSEVEEPPPVVEDDGRLEQLLSYFDLAMQMPAKEAKREYAVQHKLLSAGVCNEPRLLTGMLLMNPSLKITTKERKPPLLQPCFDENGVAEDLEILRLARILQALLDEKWKLQSAQRRLVATRYRVNVLKEEIKVLNKKLEELKRIEDSIRERE